MPALPTAWTAKLPRKPSAGHRSGLRCFGCWLAASCAPLRSLSRLSTSRARPCMRWKRRDWWFWRSARCSVRPKARRMRRIRSPRNGRRTSARHWIPCSRPSGGARARFFCTALPAAARPRYTWPWWPRRSRRARARSSSCRKSPSRRRWCAGSARASDRRRRFCTAASPTVSAATNGGASAWAMRGWWWGRAARSLPPSKTWVSS